jgi:16S rRNA (guanine527-N7)-methyltransferase
MTLAEQLRAGVQALGLVLDERQLQQLLDYQGLIAKWNKVYNLTAVRDPQEMLTHHLLDSLAVVAPLRRHAGEGGRLLDVGAGAGLPGVVIAICCPGWQVDCVDAVAKKMAFVQQAAGSLGLGNLRGIHARVETLQDRYQVVASRAFASLADFTRLTAERLADGGVWLAMKGKRPDDEIAGLDPQIDVFHVEQLVVPGLQAERCIVWMRRAAPDR